MEKAELIKDVVNLNWRINRALRKVQEDAWMELALKLPQIRSLFFITNHEGTNFKFMATALKVNASNLTGVVDRLVEQGLVRRIRDSDDRRKTRLKATAKGESMLGELREKRMNYFSRALANTSPQELRTIIEGLSLLAAATESNKDKFLTKDE